MLEIRPMSGALGAEIHGVNLSVELAEEDTLRIRKLFNEYEVIFFRDHPPMASILKSVIVPPRGGNTLWASMTSAYTVAATPPVRHPVIRTPPREYSCRFHWQAHSIAIWDNRSTQHKPVNDYFPAHRLLHRITIDGDKPY